MLEKRKIVVEKPDFSLDVLLKAVHLDETSAAEDRNEIAHMRTEALRCARPKALYGIAQISHRDGEGITAEGVRFASALVSKNLENTERILPYVLTCGTEAEEWSLAYQDDPLTQFWADAIKLQLLSIARRELEQEVRRYFADGKFSSMSPGSLPAWPLPQQRPLFALLGSVTEEIGVTLTDSCLLLPSKSGSGFFFSREGHYENCQYCPLLDCTGRRAPFVKELEGTSEYKELFHS